MSLCTPCSTWLATEASRITREHRPDLPEEEVSTVFHCDTCLLWLTLPRAYSTPSEEGLGQRPFALSAVDAIHGAVMPGTMYLWSRATKA